MPERRAPLSTRTDSLSILRERGPMTLRELCAATAAQMGDSMKYEDIHGVMLGHLSAGRARRSEAFDYRDTVWRAVK